MSNTSTVVLLLLLPLTIALVVDASSTTLVNVVDADPNDQPQPPFTTYLDRFTYDDQTIDRGDGYFDYSPTEWSSIDCPFFSNPGGNPEAIDECIGYIDKWHTGREWSLSQSSNACRWCPDGGDSSSKDCGRHHQSPIELKREYGFEPGTHPNANECIDLHWMKYEDSFCTFDQLQQANAFTIERHALRISQPIEVYRDFDNDLDGVADGVRLMCRVPGRGSRFGRIDFSKGFSDWWHLSHIDLKVPSEHVQEGKRYDAEFQLAHFYSIPWWNEMATVSVFMEAYEDAPVYRELDRIICEWRKQEFDVRNQCNLTQIEGPSYPGCFPLRAEPDQMNRRSLLRKNTASTAENSEQHTLPAQLRTIVDVMTHNIQQQASNPDHVDIKIHLDSPDSDPAEDKDWDEWIQQQSDRMSRDEELYNRLKQKHQSSSKNDDDDEEVHDDFRRLIEGDNLPFHNYFPLISSRTEYYYRYEGTQTIPPCHGARINQSRRNTNHWRVMKDPIRIHPRQLRELKRLLADRIAPLDDPVEPCVPSTAAKVTRDDTVLNQDGLGRVVDVETNRPLQSISDTHFLTFCTCKDWPSKWPEDRDWCRLDNSTRNNDHPYNFDSDNAW
mmetsp:Transcript_53447/g.130116  ORF Transcript_53447/g.130116 Transcript_53447/m.130116 type:complete len:611 (+) Transcript_53447:376-2208(+)